MTLNNHPDEPQREGRNSLAGLVLLLVLVVAVGAAAFALYRQWQNATPTTAVDRSRANPALDRIQRLSLEYYLGAHADELEQPAGSTSESVTFRSLPVKAPQPLPTTCRRPGW
ncbi:MAG: hypothetical protein R3C44_13700 [Chloroflexota bacterium]